MIVTCDGCRTKYLLGDDRVPEKGIRVRCPKCRNVWRLMPGIEDSVFEVASTSFADEAPVAETPRGGWAAFDQSAVPGSARMSAPMEEEIVIREEKPPRPASVAEDPELRRRKDRSKRLARVFVSDILIYNKDKRDRGLANGDLMTVLGPEIKKAWEAYKEKVGSDLVESTDYFRDALNEILADGQKIF